MGKRTAGLLFFSFIIIAAFPLTAQEDQETDYTFYLRFEDDESNDVPSLPDYWDRPFEAVNEEQRYEETAFQFDLVSLGGRNGRTDADTPDALIDVFDILHRSDHPLPHLQSHHRRTLRSPRPPHRLRLRLPLHPHPHLRSNRHPRHRVRRKRKYF